MPIRTILILILMPAFVWGARKSQIEVDGALKENLNGLLKVAADLHKACYEQNEPKIATSLKSLLVSIRRVKRTTGQAQSQKPHLDKILEAIQSEVRMFQNGHGSERRNNLQNAFQQLVQIVKVYKLDHYRVFFCSKDRSVWLQESWKPQNPIHPDKYKNCGKRVR